MDWAEAALRAYSCADPAQKCALTLALPQPDRPLDQAADLPAQPGRPARPQLIHPAKVPRRKLCSEAGRVALVHAVAHIEFNAINLALDAALRFAGMPLAFYQDWVSVARDEARHHQMLSERLGQMGAAYGDCSAHNGLWEMAEKTAHDALLRMALVPRVLEARGLDVTPGMIARLREVGDTATVQNLEIILAEEVRHVAIGSHWFRHLCAQRGLEADSTFAGLMAQNMPGNKGAAGHFNVAARREAGFSEQELLALGA